MAYTLSDLQSSVQDDLKDSSFSTDRISRYLNAGQADIFNTHLFKFCEKRISGSLTIGEYTYGQQLDHQSTIGGVLYDPSNTGSRFILDENSYLPHRDFFDQYPAPEIQTNAMPRAWTEFGDQLYFNCPVDKAYTLKQRYYRSATRLSAPDDVPDVPESLRELLELYALAKAEKYRGNHDIAATYKQDYEDMRESMLIRYAPATRVGPARMKSSRVRVHV